MTNYTAPLECDGLIFDMDGTLWDAVDSYVTIWNKTIDDCGLSRQHVTRADLITLMGRQLDYILAKLIPGPEGRSPQVLDRLFANETDMMPRLGGRLYAGVTETMSRLHGRIPLFVVSNCGRGNLENFLDVSGLRPLITDHLSQGETGKPKSANISTVVERYNLKTPYYVGDTATDAEAARTAGTGMIWCRYGFGHVDAPDYIIDSFAELLALRPIASAL